MRIPTFNATLPLATLLIACQDRARLPVCSDEVALSVAVSSPSSSTAADGSGALVLGQAISSAGAAVLSVSVASVAATTTDGFLTWTATVPHDTLQALADDEGLAIVTVVARDICGHTNSEQFVSVLVEPVQAETGEGEETGGTETGDGGGSEPGDTGSGDTGSGDTGSGDTGSGDTGSGDTGSGDTGSGDTGSGDTGSGDTGSGDTGG